MVFSFMLLISAEQKGASVPAQKGPRAREPVGRSSLAAVPGEKIGRLVRKDDGLYLAFGDRLYHPRRDLGDLLEDRRVTEVRGEDGQRVLYLEEDTSSRILLGDYLQEFQALSGAGIGVAFAKRIP